MSISFAVCSVCEFLTLVLFASDVCPDSGCPFLNGAGWAIAAGVIWGFTSFLCLISKGPAKIGQTIACCCCPTHAVDHIIDGSEGVPLVRDGGPSSSSKPTTRITITETVDDDGTKVTDKLTVHPDGSETVETVTSTLTQPRAVQSVLNGSISESDTK